MDEVFNVLSYLNFLEYMASELYEKNKKVYFIQDNASYHKNSEIWQWFKENRRWIEVHNLPPYCPELNAAEPLWKYTRRQGTHNKCFENEAQIHDTLNAVFAKVQQNPSEIAGYLRPFI